MTDRTIELVDAQGETIDAPGQLHGAHRSEAKLEDERFASATPQPTGYQILLALPQIEEEYDSGLIKAQETMHYEKVSSVVGFVMAMGPDCYGDEKRFPSGPYCKEGDFVIIKAYSGARISVFGKELRLIHDDDVLAVVDDPRGIRRAG